MDLFNQITRTKVILPRRRPDLLSRQRLIDLVYHLLDQRLTIITAPPGYGKTSLLIDVAHHTKLAVCWYTLDGLDQDPQRFIAHFIASLHQRFPLVGQQAAAVLKSAKGKLDLDQLVTILVNELYDNITEYFVVVIDDYHLVDSNEEVNYFVNQFVQQVGENCHVVIASRSMLPLPDLVLMAVRSQAGGLSFEELTFRPDEVRSLLLRNYNVEISESEAKDLVAETEGWVTALLLSSEVQRKYNMQDRLRLAQASGANLYLYLAQQVLDQQPQPVREFLLQTSLLEEFDSQLCLAVFGPNANYEQLINTVLQNNLFVLRVEDGGVWLRYHHLFRDFLQNQFAKRYPAEKITILNRLAAVYIDRQAWEKAHAIYRRLNDMERIARLLEQAGLPLIRAGRHKILTEWLDDLPLEILELHPFLYGLRGYLTQAIQQGRYMAEDGIPLLNKAFEALQSTPDNQQFLARTLVWRAVLRHFSADYDGSIRDADRAWTLIQGKKGSLVIEAEALRVKGLNLYHLGQLYQAIEFQDRALTISKELGDEELETIILLELGLTQEKVGTYSLAEGSYSKAVKYGRRSGNISLQAYLLNNMGVLQHYRGNYVQAGRLLEEALANAQQSGNRFVEAAAMTSLGDLFLDLDAPQTAQDIYDQAYEIAVSIDFHFLLLHLNLSQVALRQLNGDFGQARSLLSLTHQLVEESGSHHERNLYQLGLGRFALATNDLPTAISGLAEAATGFAQGEQLVEGTRSYFYLAFAYLKMNDPAQLQSALQSAFSLARRLESWSSLIRTGREVKSLLEFGPTPPDLASQADRLLEQIRQFEQEIPSLRRRLRSHISTVPLPPPNLRIQALGKAEVIVDGKAVSNSDWQTKVARDLFFCLLANSNGLSREAICAIFWAENSPQQLKEQFKITIRRIRRVLGPEAILFQEDRYFFNETLDYEYDVELFLKKLEQARPITDRKKQLMAYQELLTLYQGDYLPEISGVWALPERRRLAQLYQETIMKLAHYYLETKEYEAMLEQCQLALAQDPCLEQAHRLAMRAHAALGNPVEVTRQFQYCQQVLQTEIGVHPSPQTEALYKELIH
jgi:ATP/maltotriose-dependent transcriptional regulator MalT